MRKLVLPFVYSAPSASWVAPATTQLYGTTIAMVPTALLFEHGQAISVRFLTWMKQCHGFLYIQTDKELSRSEKVLALSNGDTVATVQDSGEIDLTAYCRNVTTILLAAKYKEFGGAAGAGRLYAATAYVSILERPRAHGSEVR